MNNKEIDLEIAYQEALDYLYTFIDYSLTRMDRISADNFDLSRMSAFMALIGDPQNQYKVIHITGTKGKGSSAAMIASALQAAGYRVGFYTSPHLVDFTERMQVNGEHISHSEFVELVEEIKPFVGKVENLTTFELTTALGFLYFARQNVDIAVVEVGLGGRLDATNIVNPLVSVITAISYDHTYVLGNTLAEIATEKAGIIKENRPVVLAPQKEQPRQVVERIAKERKAPLTEVGKDYFYAPWTHSLDSQSFLVWSAQEQPMVNRFIESGGRSDWEPLRLNIPLLGSHQVENAATAYTVLQVARKEGLTIPEKAIHEGFSKVFWPGRFEVLRRYPPFILDSAHNPDSALKLRLAIDDYLPGQQVILLFGASEDKDIRGMYAELLPRARIVLATQSVHPRAMDAIALADIARQFGKPVKAIGTVEEALSEALRLAGREIPVVVTGSLFVTAAVRQLWFERQKVNQL